MNIRCDKCKSKKTRVRIKTNERVCEYCGYIGKIITQEPEEDREVYHG